MFPDVGRDRAEERGDEETGLEKDANGHLRIGPRFPSFSATLARLMEAALGTLADDATILESERLAIAREAVAMFAGDIDAAWTHIRESTTKRQRRAVNLKREDLFEARGWLSRSAEAA